MTCFATIVPSASPPSSDRKRTRPADQSSTSVRSKMCTPRASTTRASPRTSFAGCTRAHAGSKTADGRAAIERGRARRRGHGLLVAILEPVDAEAPRLGDIGFGAPTLHLVAGEHERAAAFEVAVDALARRDPADLVDGVDHGASHRDGGVEAVPTFERTRRLREQRRAPSAVPARRAEPGDIALEHRDRERRVGARQLVRRPQRGEAAADEGDIEPGVRRQRVARPQVVESALDEVVEPEAHPTVGIG